MEKTACLFVDPLPKFSKTKQNSKQMKDPKQFYK